MIKIGLFNYIINLDEMSESIVKAYTSKYLMNNGIQMSKGLLIEQSSYGDKEITWTVSNDIFITGIRFTINNLRNIGYDDNWDMYIDNINIMSSVYVKEMNEYKRFRNLYFVSKGQVIKFIYHNRTDIIKDLWFDLDYIQKDI